MSATLRIEDVHVSLGGHPVLRGLCLALAPGEVRAMVGLNGAGKTTALRVVLGMLRPDEGLVRLFGEEIASGRRSTWRRVGHLVESPGTYPELTARENVAATARLHEAHPRDAARRTEQLAEALGMASQLDTRVGRLSLGTRQKVGLISALAHDPDLAVLDEPTNGLDPLAVVAFREILQEAAAAGRSALLTSHHFDELARVAHGVDILHHGRIIDTLTPDGGDLEQAFFNTVVAADRAAQGA